MIRPGDVVEVQAAGGWCGTWGTVDQVIADARGARTVWVNRGSESRPFSAGEVRRVSQRELSRGGGVGGVPMIFALQEVGPDGLRPEVERINAENESALLLLLWRRQRVHGAGLPADRWGKRAAWAAFRWHVVIERRERAG